MLREQGSAVKQLSGVLRENDGALFEGRTVISETCCLGGDDQRSVAVEDVTSRVMSMSVTHGIKKELDKKTKANIVLGE